MRDAARKLMPMLFAVCVALPGAAQRDEGATLGARLGVHQPYFSFSGVKNEGQPGLSAGVYSKGPLADRLYLQPELSASYERVRLVPGNGPAVRLQFIYAECAFLGVYNVAEKLALHAGPFIGYRVYFKHEPEGATEDTLYTTKHLSPVNAGLVYGAAYEFSRFDVGLRFNHGLFIMGKVLEGAADPDALRTRNAFLQLYFTYVF